MKENFTVYMHVSPSEKRYIGLTCQKPENRWNKGEGYVRQPHFYNAIQKYGWDNFLHIIIADKLSKNQAVNLEINLISFYNTKDSMLGYNHFSGGNLGAYCCSEETRKRMSISGKNRKVSEETKKKMSASKLGEKNGMFGYKHSDKDKKEIGDRIRGRKVSEETKKKMSVSKLGEKNPMYGHKYTDEEKALKSAKMSGENNPMYGKRHTAETKKKISECGIGRKHTEEAKRKIAESSTGRKRTEKFKRLAKERASKKVIQLNLKMEIIKEFDSINSAVYELINFYKFKSCDRQTLSLHCKNNTKYKNFLWKFKDV